MSVETIDRERGDDRRAEVEIERLTEMYSQPSVPDRVYISDAPNVPQAGIGDIIPIHRRHSATRIGGIATRRIFIRQALPRNNQY